jgi:hypothetical protein
MINMQSASLDDRGTLLAAWGEHEEPIAEASIAELVAIALAWDEERFVGARIRTEAGMRLTPSQIVSLGKLMGIEREPIPWSAESHMLYSDIAETMTLKQAVIRWRSLPAVIYALTEIQTADMRSRAETFGPEEIERLSRILSARGE